MHVLKERGPHTFAFEGRMRRSYANAYIEEANRPHSTIWLVSEASYHRDRAQGDVYFHIKSLERSLLLVVFGEDRAGTCLAGRRACTWRPLGWAAQCRIGTRNTFGGCSMLIAVWHP